MKCFFYFVRLGKVDWLILSVVETAKSWAYIYSDKKLNIDFKEGVLLTKMHECEQCDQKFKRKENLNRHHETSHFMIVNIVATALAERIV